MSMNDDQSSSVPGAIREGMRDIMRDARRELMPRIPWRLAGMAGAGVAVGVTTFRRDLSCGPDSRLDAAILRACC